MGMSEGKAGGHVYNPPVSVIFFGIFVGADWFTIPKMGGLRHLILKWRYVNVPYVWPYFVRIFPEI